MTDNFNPNDKIYTYFSILLSKAPQLLFAFTLGILMCDSPLAIVLLILYSALEIYSATSNVPEFISEARNLEETAKIVEKFTICPICGKENVTLLIKDVYKNGDETLTYSANCNACGYSKTDCETLNELAHHWTSSNESQH